MRRTLPTLLLLLPCFASAQATPRSLLWRITSAKAESSYVYGTFHSRDARVFRLQDSTLVAFSACDMVAGELEVNDTRKMDPAVMNAMFLPPGRSLDRLYSKRDYKKVIAMLKEKLGPLAPLCTRVRPFYTIAMLSEMELGNDSAQVLDAWFQDQALAGGKKVVGLETINEQLTAVEKIPLRDQARLLLEVALRDTADAELQQAMNAYVAHDLDALMLLVGRDGLPEHADKALLDERNSRMADRLAEHMRGHRVFAAVGAAHLVGDNGLLALLREKGYRVEAVGVAVH